MGPAPPPPSPPPRTPPDPLSALLPCVGGGGLGGPGRGRPRRVGGARRPVLAAAVRAPPGSGRGVPVPWLLVASLSSHCFLDIRLVLWYHGGGGVAGRGGPAPGALHSWGCPVSAFLVPVSCSCPAGAPSCAAVCSVCGRSVPQCGSLVSTFVTLCSCPAAGLLVPACSVSPAVLGRAHRGGVPVVLLRGGAR